MNLLDIGYLFLSIAFSVAGQIFLKFGAIKLAKISATNIIGKVIEIFLTPELILGLTCYAIGAIAYILLLTKVDLSMAAPAVSLVYVFSVLLGYFVFKETIPITRAIGLGFIVSGVILVAWK